jgi:hypothetical protein
MTLLPFKFRLPVMFMLPGRFRMTAGSCVDGPIADAGLRGKFVEETTGVTRKE